MSKITVTIEMGKDYSTHFVVDNVNEIETKLKDWHEMSNFERDHLKKKGTLQSALASGWYYLEQDNE